MARSTNDGNQLIATMEGGGGRRDFTIVNVAQVSNGLSSPLMACYSVVVAGNAAVVATCAKQSSELHSSYICRHTHNLAGIREYGGFVDRL